MIDSCPSDQVLLAACRAGDEEAWEQVLIKYERLVYLIPLNYGLRREDAADIAQIAFTSLIQRLDDLYEESNLGGWLVLVARRHTWRLLKRTQQEAPDELDEEAVQTLLPDHDNPIERWELVEWLHSGLGHVGERCRELLLALYFEAELKERFAHYAQAKQTPGFFQQLLAALTFDSAQQPALAGVRASETAQVRQLVYTTSVADVVLYVQPRKQDGCFILRLHGGVCRFAARGLFARPGSGHER